MDTGKIEGESCLNEDSDTPGATEGRLTNPCSTEAKVQVATCQLQGSCNQLYQMGPDPLSEGQGKKEGPTGPSRVAKKCYQPGPLDSLINRNRQEAR